MEPKKSKKADLENKKSLFFQTGLVATLALILIAFEWTTRDVTMGDLGNLAEIVVEDDLIPITRPEEIQPPPPPPPILVTETLEIVEDDVEIDDELFIEDVEARPDTRIEFRHMAIADNDEPEDEDFFYFVEDMPDFRGGGQEAFRQWIFQNLRYPNLAAENGIQGRVVVHFIVNTDGSVSDAKVIRGVDPSLDQEALRVINASPRWTPGQQRGRAVRVAFNFPIDFKLL
jgi:periplasmic protein TonB